MLEITIAGKEWFDEVKGEFVSIEDTTLQMEHSLLSLSKWEKKWKKPFFSTKEKTTEEILDYFACMIINPHVDPQILGGLTAENVEEIHKYIDDPMTATTFSDKENKRFNREVITNEIIYYWMISLNIPVEFQKWHLNRLITLIRVCNIMNQPPKKMSKKELLSRNAALNAVRRKQFKQ